MIDHIPQNILSLYRLERPYSQKTPITESLCPQEAQHSENYYPEWSFYQNSISQKIILPIFSVFWTWAFVEMITLANDYSVNGFSGNLRSVLLFFWDCGRTQSRYVAIIYCYITCLMTQKNMHWWNALYESMLCTMCAYISFIVSHTYRHYIR